MSALQTLLSPQVLTKVVSQKAAASSWLLDLFQLGPGQSQETYMGHGRFGAFNIYNHVRSVAKGRAPGTAAGRSAPNPMGTVNFTYPRMHDSVTLLAETLNNLGRIDDPAQRDAAGADMIKRQTNTLGEMAANWRKAMLMGMLRDSLYFAFSGDDVYLNMTSGLRINFQMPAGNKTQLNMLGAGNIIDASWATSTTNIPLHLLKINEGFQRLNGGKLCAVICGLTVFDAIRKNDHVQEEHGTSHSPYLRFDRLAVEDGPGKTAKNVFVVELRSAPGVLFYVTDETLDIGPDADSLTATKIVADNTATFIGFEPGTEEVVQCYLGSEPIAEYDGGPENVKVGTASWSVKRSNPTATELFVLDNCLTVNHIPDSIATGTVIF